MRARKLPYNSSTEQLVSAFIAATLPKEEWTHEAHLKVGLWHLLRYSQPQSIEQLRQRIKCYNVACGIENTDSQGYHETITRFYVWLIGRFLQTADLSLSLDLLAEALIARYGDKLLPLQYYSRDRLMSKTARLEWLEPDLKPLL